MSVTADTTITANTNDPKTYKLWNTDPTTGVATVIDLSSVTDIELRFKDAPADGSTVKTFKLSDVGNKITVSDATGGEILFTYDVTDFIIPALYYIFVLITDSGGVKPVPNKIRYSFRVVGD